MKFKQLAIAATLLLASSAASALIITMSDITITSDDNAVGGLQWTATPVIPTVTFNLGYTNSLVTYGSLNIDLFDLTQSASTFGEVDPTEVSFTLSPPGSSVSDNTVLAKAFGTFFGPEKFQIDFDDNWLNMGQYQFRFLDAEIDGTSGSVDLMAEFAQIPEPSVLALFGAGLLGLGAVRRRKIKS
jgi:hypothetical protein